MKRFQRRVYRLVFLALVLVFATLLVSNAHHTNAFNTAMPPRNKGTPFGVVASLGNRVRTDEIPTMVHLMREAGVQWQREEIFWHHVQDYPGGPFRWNGNDQGFYNYDAAIESQVRAGIQVVGLLDYNPAWFKGKNPHPDEWINDWGNFVYNAVARYGRDRGWVKNWELWNEPNLAPSGYESGLYQVEDFVRLLEVGAAAARSADPEATIIMGGLAPTWTQQPSPYSYDYFDYLEAVGEAGGWEHVDVIAIHPYRPGAPEGAVEGRERAMDLRIELEHLDELLLRFGPRPIWITELGWSTHQSHTSAWPRVDLDTQAFFLIRSYILAISHPSVEKVFWYDFRNDTVPADTTYTHPVYDDMNEQLHYGLLRRSYPLNPADPHLRKPSFLAYRMMTHTLGGLSLQEIIADGDTPEMLGVYWYRFGNGARTVDVLWRTYGNTPVVSSQCGCSEAIVRSWKGELKRLVYTGDGTVELTMETPGTPMFVEYDPPPVSGGATFQETGRTLRGSFHQFWKRNGGLYRFGYPLTDEMIEPEAGTGIPRVVQYFDRARFMHFPEYSGTPYEVQVSNLGSFALLQQGVNWHTLPRMAFASEGGRFFAETGHHINRPFLYAWQKYGGLTTIGYPISHPYEQYEEATGRPYYVQYFERARIEFFPTFQGLPEKIEFGMLSRELYTRWEKM